MPSCLAGCAAGTGAAALASCRGGAACGLAAVLVSAGSDFGRIAPAVAVWVGLAAGAFDFAEAVAEGFCSGAGSSLFELNRLPKKPLMPPELDAEATWTDDFGAAAGFDSDEARLIVPVLPVLPVSDTSPGGLTCAGIVPEAVRMTEPGLCDFTAARKVGFMPPSTPMRTGDAGVPRLTSSAVCASSRRVFSRTAAEISSGTR